MAEFYGKSGTKDRTVISANPGQGPPVAIRGLHACIVHRKNVDPPFHAATARLYYRDVAAHVRARRKPPVS